MANINYAERRKNFMDVFRGNIALCETIPGVASQLIHDEFKLSIVDPTTVPITFVTGWTEILKFVGSQKCDEFAMKVGGVSIEYVTEYSETDKNTNIVPQMFHETSPVFVKQEHQIVPGSSAMDEMLERYNVWRTANLAETCDKIERDVYSKVLNEYGIDLMTQVAILPILAATYVAGVQIARETRETVNMYNIFEIDVYEDDRVVLTPLSTVKQYLKNDSKK